MTATVVTTSAAKSKKKKDMRALGGAITSPCSNDTGYRRPSPAIFGLNTFYYAVVGLLFNLNIVYKGTLWETAKISLCLRMACTVVIEIQKPDASIVL